MAARPNSLAEAQMRLKVLYARCGWTQSPPDPRKRARKKANYRRGYEVRFSVPAGEAQEVVRLLKAAEFEPGKAYPKANHLRVPLYGREQVRRFLALLETKGA